VLRAPVHDRQQHRIEVEALGGQAVLVALWSLLVELTLQNLVGDERVEAVAENVPRHAGIALQLLETPDAEERFAEDEERPPLTDHGERIAHGAVVPGPVAFQHVHIIVAFCNPLV
jgi:hypothetical protein